MKIYQQRNVLDAAVDRLRFLFREFPEVVVGVSGGKDSTVVFELALIVAREAGPAAASRYVDRPGGRVARDRGHGGEHHDPAGRPAHVVPDADGHNEQRQQLRTVQLLLARVGPRKWAHPQHPLSIKVNRYGTERFHDLFGAIFKVEFAQTRACYISGVRTQESPKRFVALTDSAKYKWITWGRKLDAKRGHYTFYPIYDWEISDVWKAIHDHGWAYNRIYDRLYQYGIAPVHMRISNLHHETAIQDLLRVQEIEPETWVRVADRIAGANTIKHLRSSSFTCPAELPYMFRSWEEYAEHLIENIVQERATARKSARSWPGSSRSTCTSPSARK